MPDEVTRRRAFDGLRHRITSPAMDAKARAALDKGKEAMAAEREVASRRIGQALGLDAPDMAAVAGVASPPAAKGWVPVLFASSSMPVTTLRSYAAQLERAHGVIAFRGMPGGLRKVAPMAKLTAEVLRLDPGCEGPACAMRGVQVIVDPLVFRQHGIARVPALAMIPGDPTQPYCERDDESPRAAHVIYGDAALSGLLEEYARLGGKMEVSDAQARLSRR
jgi:type-F conjugative transfer system pilin assembly protein TrbC